MYRLNPVNIFISPLIFTLFVLIGCGDEVQRVIDPITDDQLNLDDAELFLIQPTRISTYAEQFKDDPLKLALNGHIGVASCSTFAKMEYVKSDSGVDVWLWGAYFEEQECLPVEINLNQISFSIPPPFVGDTITVRIHGPDSFRADKSVKLLERSTESAWATYTEGSSGLPSNIIVAIDSDSQGRIWGSTDFISGPYYSAFSFEDGESTLFEGPFSGSRAISIDSQGNFWAASWGTPTIAKFDGSAWATWNLGSVTWDIHSMSIGTDDTIWLASHYGKLHHFQEGQSTLIPLPSDAYPQYKGGSVLQDVAGGVWYVRECGLIRYYGNGEWTDIDDFPNFCFADNIFYQDLAGNLWVGAQNTLLKFDGSNWITFPLDALSVGVQYPYISAIRKDSRGHLWLGTNYGLVKFDGSNLELFTTDNSGLPYNRVNTLEITIDDHIWIGTNVGLTEYRND